MPPRLKDAPPPPPIGLSGICDATASFFIKLRPLRSANSGESGPSQQAGSPLLRDDSRGQRHFNETRPSLLGYVGALKKYILVLHWEVYQMSSCSINFLRLAWMGRVREKQSTSQGMQKLGELLVCEKVLR